MLRDSPELQRVRLNRTTLRLLDEPRLQPANLVNFYVTYRVKENPFYPLFLSLKGSSAKQREAGRRSKRKRIEAIMAGYPPDVLRLMRYLAAVEGRLRPDIPLCMKVLIPTTLKRARELSSFSRMRWISSLRDAVKAIAGGYRTIILRNSDELIARSILDCLPDPRTGKTPSRAGTKAKFRALSKANHPDSGGDAAAFRLLSWARDILLG
jgi:hypothetical protein